MSISLIMPFAIATPAGDVCLNELAAICPIVFSTSTTRSHEFIASNKLIYPGFPFKTEKGI